MKQWFFLLIGIVVLGWVPNSVQSQGDWAVYDTFTRFSPAVYSVSVEIPQQYIMDRHEELIRQFRDLQENYSDIVTGSTDTLAGQYMFDNLIRQLRRKLDVMRDQMLNNNRVRCSAFAVGPHHLVSLSTIVKSATLGGTISIKDDFHWISKAELKGADDFTGVAVLEVKDVTFTQFINLQDYRFQNEDSSQAVQPGLPGSNQLPVASYVVSIQRPYDLPSSPFSGIIGGYNRLLGLFEIEKYIQTDLPLYPGNEGSPVFSPSGQLVGMLATEFRLGNWPGVTFLIPADTIADSALSIIEWGKRDRGWISGVGLGQDSHGIIVEEVVPRSPAALAGLLKGDLILGFNGQREKKVWNLIDHISRSKPNDMIHFEIKRGSQVFLIDIKTTLRQSRK